LTNFFTRTLLRASVDVRNLLHESSFSLTGSPFLERSFRSFPLRQKRTLSLFISHPPSFVFFFRSVFFPYFLPRYPSPLPSKVSYSNGYSSLPDVPSAPSLNHHQVDDPGLQLSVLPLSALKTIASLLAAIRCQPSIRPVNVTLPRPRKVCPFSLTTVLFLTFFSHW